MDRVGEQVESGEINRQKHDGQAEGIQQQRAFHMAIFRQLKGVPEGVGPLCACLFPLCPLQFLFKILIHSVSCLFCV